jgi:toxin-antitoxin system PIN domain toxin
VIVDVNVLLIALNSGSAGHDRARDWLDDALNGPVRIGLPWATLTSFLRISTSRAIFPAPLSPTAAMDQVREWLAAPAAWTPRETDAHATVLGDLIERHRLTGNLMPDAHLAALAIEHGVGVCSTDGDFARFTELQWHNPLAAASGPA